MNLIHLTSVNNVTQEAEQLHGNKVPTLEDVLCALNVHGDRLGAGRFS